MRFELNDDFAQRVVRIRHRVFDVPYRATTPLCLKSPCCYGFLLGSLKKWSAPCFDFSLPCRIQTEGKDLEKAPDVLRSLLPVCRKLAKEMHTEVAGLFTLCFRFAVPDEKQQQLLGYCIDLTRELELPYFMYFQHGCGDKAEVFMPLYFPHVPLKFILADDQQRHNPCANPGQVYRRWYSFIKAAGGSRYLSKLPSLHAIQPEKKDFFLSAVINDAKRGWPNRKHYNKDIPKKWLKKRMRKRDLACIAEESESWGALFREQWARFLAVYQPGDELWEFSGSLSPGDGSPNYCDLGWRFGYAILRGGNVIQYHVMALS